jgi:hypothetical protein
MSEFRSALKAYNLEKVLAADRNSGCLVIDVGHDENGQSIPSHAHVIERVDHVLHYARAAAFAATKLYIVGDWNLTPIDSGGELDEEAQETKVGSAHISERTRAKSDRPVFLIQANF